MLNGLISLSSAASNKFSQLTTVAKAILCIPVVVSSLLSGGGGLGSLKSIGGSIAAGIAGAAEAAVASATALITSAIQAQLAKLTGAINSIINTINSVIATVAGAIAVAKKFAEDIKKQVEDVKKFISDKENCNFAAANLASCIIGQALSSLTPKSVKGISLGLDSIDNFTSNLANKISSPAGAVGDFMNKANSELRRASSVVSAVEII